ncbi:unnamed protein product [Eruca vesicaria subsp. sativa]|uniref:Protein CPR-5 n=1 Tax=Eruca vesicaria subsp. sativa TaxID=29727 RepID=A0ABC8JHA6_ERUVS|nr:unnamed protein product [Eruca vesicaria subsp. sativa]
MANHQPENFNDELKDETMSKNKKKKPSSLEKRKLKGKNKEITNRDEASSSSKSTQRVSHRLRSPTVRLGMARRSVDERQAEALALRLGMSIAAFVNLVLERASVAGQNVYVDDLGVISASAIKESLANVSQKVSCIVLLHSSVYRHPLMMWLQVYGHKLGSFATNFEESFNTTLRILKMINESPFQHQLNNNNNAASYNVDSELSADEAIQGGARTTSSVHEIVLHEEPRQLSCVQQRSLPMSMTPFERFYIQEQALANDLKREENGLKERELRDKKIELALRYESNSIGKSKLEMNVLKKAFDEERFRTEQEDTRNADMVRKIMDWLVVSVFIMLASMLYGAYVFSQQRIMEATSICEPSEETTSSWWVPKQVSSISTEFNILLCRVRVWVQSFFGVLMILVFTYFIIQRSSGTKQTMPVTFIVLFLGIVCGLPGKLCVDTLGGNGKLWLLLWEVFCLLQFVANVFTLALYRFLYGPVTVTEGERCGDSMIPYWARRSVFFGLILLVLPVVNGLLPFATVGEWGHHFTVVVFESLGGLGSDD